MAYLRLLVPCFAALLLAGCGQFAKQGELDKSLATWQALKAQNGDTYRYETSFSSWAGFGDITTLTVQDEKVISRAYEAYRSDGNTGEQTVTESWTEERAEVGSHEAGAAPRTIDELHRICRSEVLTQSSLENDFYLEFRDDGVLKTCVYVPKGCADDCSRGVNISSLEFLRNLKEQAELDESFETWQQLKAEKGEHYRYEVSAGSIFGPSYDTTLTVQADRVVQRDLAVSQIDDEGNTTIVESWSETGDALGTHDDGAELTTLDERYGRCKNDVLSQNPVNNDIYLAFQDNGVLRDCSYTAKGTAYDGGSPVIVSLEFLVTKPD